MQKTNRQSNLELMRIFSMFMIVLYHIIVHSQILQNTTGIIQMIIVFIKSTIFIHVDSFVLLTGYFQYTKKLKISKIINLYNEAWFYKILICIVLLLCGFNLSKYRIFTQLTPMFFDDYWFIITYLLLLIVSPILNNVINNTSKRDLKKFILILFIVFSFIPTITADKFYNTTFGYSLGNFILLYFIGAYLHINPINKMYLFKNYSKNMKILLYFAIFLFCSTINFILFYFNSALPVLGTISRIISVTIGHMISAYSNPILIVQVIMYFSIFINLDIKNSKFINYISSLTLGIYLISDNSQVRSILYTVILKIPTTNIGYEIIYKIFIYAILIFIICAIIEAVRKFFAQMIAKLKFNQKIKLSIIKYINSLTNE